MRKETGVLIELLEDELVAYRAAWFFAWHGYQQEQAFAQARTFLESAMGKTLAEIMEDPSCVGC